ncbi:MAG: hypothetical protein IJ282_01930 [Lachnospiraceae bacterium]|nr:hypothetical protein [Lachnospiraceae bacterium]
MKKAILKGTVFGLVFFIALIVIGQVMNMGNTDMTAEMAEATFPVICMDLEGQTYNELHGYAKAMDIPYMRENITVLDENRKTAFTLQKYGSDVAKISFEVRSVDGSRLIEKTEVTDFEEDEDKIFAQITLKDLIDKNQEYALIFLVEMGNGQTVRYYTRVVWSTNYSAAEKISYVMDFNSKTFDKEAAKDLTKYLETNSQGDNSTFHVVDIHSKLSQVTWGKLNVHKEMEPVANLIELATETASIKLHYVVSMQPASQKQYYYVEEFYRIRYTPDRTYLLDFERNMTRFFQEDESVYANDKIVLGIAAADIPFVESQDGNNFAFVIQNKLCSYNVTDNKLAVLFCFYNEKNSDVRTIHNSHEFKILDVDETGSVRFVVYGYMNRGRHEGEVGVQICNYDSSLNTIEEIAYIPYTKSDEILREEMEHLLYASRENYLYLTMDENVYEVNLDTKTYDKIIHTTTDGSMQVSDNQKVIAWQNTADAYSCEEVVLKNLNSREQRTIKARSGEYIMPLGFMGEDLIYGYAKEDDIVRDSAGRVTFPMYRICIVGTDGTLLMKYEQEDIYVVSCSIEGNQINMQRVVKAEDGRYMETTDDQIMNSQEVEVGKNKVSGVVTELYETVVQITVKKDINAKTLKVLTPKEVLFEGAREISFQNEDLEKRYYVYGLEGVEAIYRNPANAVNLAYEISGVVLGDDGQYVWIRGNRVLKNQIMAIEGAGITQEKDSIAVCLDTMLKYEGVIRNSEYLLAGGETIYSILENNLPDAQILDLKGCTLESVLYYVNRDIPVFATLNDGTAVLIIGFNQYNIVVLDPVKGAESAIYKKGMNDSREWLERNGNCFITYVR